MEASGHLCFMCSLTGSLCFSGLGSRALWAQKWVILQSILDKYNFHPYGNKFFNYNNQKSQVPMLILHGLGLRSNPRIQCSLKTLTVWAGLPAVYTKGQCVSKSIIRLYWLLSINLWWLLTRCKSLSSLKLFCLLSPPRIIWMHTINLLPPYLWFPIATSLNTGSWISVDWN